VFDISNFGEGSSFDRRSFDGKANALNLAERWRCYGDDPAYRSIFVEARQLGEMSKEFFGFNPLAARRA
jgi:hypothetical protein